MKNSVIRTSTIDAPQRRRFMAAVALVLGVIAMPLGGCTVVPPWEENTASSWSPDKTGWHRGNRGGGRND